MKESDVLKKNSGELEKSVIKKIKFNFYYPKNIVLILKSSVLFWGFCVGREDWMKFYRNEKWKF